MHYILYSFFIQYIIIRRIPGTLYSEKRTERVYKMSKDTLELLRECDSGIKMAVGSIDEVSGHIKDEGSQKPARKEQGGAQPARRYDKEQLASLGDDGKDPGIMAKSMSWIKTNVKLGMNDSDRTVAGLMTDGATWA